MSEKTKSATKAELRKLEDKIIEQINAVNRLWNERHRMMLTIAMRGRLKPRKKVIR